MSVATAAYYVNASGNVGCATGGELHSVVVTDAASATLRSGGSGGAVLLVVKATAGTTQQVQFAAMGYAGP